MAPRRPKLLFLAPSAYTLGGVQEWLAQLIPDLQDRDWPVTLALPAGQWHDFERYRDRYPSLPALPLGNPSGSRAGRRRGVAALLREQQPDLVLGVNLGDLYPAAWQERHAGHFRGRVAMTLHGFVPTLLADLQAHRPVIDAVIATNQLTCSLCHTQANIPSERILYAPYGVNPDPYPTLTDPTPDSPLKLAWVGRLDQDQKRVHDLPGIMDELDRIGIVAQLSIAGGGTEEASLRAALAPRLKSGQVRFLGHLTPEELGELVYQNHDVLLITSSWETGPIVAWEAMAAGLAVVSSRYVGSGLEGALRADVTALLFPVGDATTAAAQLARLQDPQLRGQLRRAGRQLVQQRYGRDQSCQAWEQAFERCLNLPPLACPPAVPPLPPQGRLDRWVGSNRAEDLRRLLGIRFQHTSPGGEWPHALHSGACDEKTLLTLAAALEAALEAEEGS